MPAYQDIEARIVVDDEPLPEYAPTLEVGADGVMTASCWVPSEAGKVRLICDPIPHTLTDRQYLQSFYMQCTDNRHPRVATQGRVAIDGVEVGGRIIRADTGPFALDRPDTMFRGPHRAGGEYATLVFSALELTGALCRPLMCRALVLSASYRCVQCAVVYSYGEHTLSDG
jgi:hypothetical protein